MDCVDRRRVGVDADGRGGSSFTRMDCVGCRPRVGVDVDGRGLLSFRQMDVVGCLSREWTGLGVDADGRGLLSFTKMDGVGRLHAVGCGSTNSSYTHTSNIGSFPKHAIHPGRELPTTYLCGRMLQLPAAPDDECDGWH